MPLHSDFAKMRNSMRKQYGEKKGDSVFWGYVNKNKMDETKSMKGQAKRKEASLIPNSWVEYMASIKQEYMPPASIEAPYKPKNIKQEDIPTKWEDYINKINKQEQPSQPEMAKKYNKSLERAEEGAAGKITPAGKGKFQPWYAKNRPYGPPRSPDQDRMAMDMNNALSEVTAIWNELDTGKRAEEKKEKVGKFLEEQKDFLKRPMK